MKNRCSACRKRVRVVSDGGSTGRRAGQLRIDTIPKPIGLGSRAAPRPRYGCTPVIPHVGELVGICWAGGGVRWRTTLRALPWKSLFQEF
jgi:hypothetical protein